MKRSLALLTAAALCLSVSLSACGGGSQPAADLDNPAEEVSQPPSELNNSAVILDVPPADTPTSEADEAVDWSTASQDEDALPEDGGSRDKGEEAETPSAAPGEPEETSVSTPAAVTANVPAATPEPLQTSEPEPEATPEPVQPATARETAVTYIGSSASSLIAVIGAPISRSYAPSCLGDGEDGELIYDGFTVYTYREGDSELVQDVL